MDCEHLFVHESVKKGGDRMCYEGSLHRVAHNIRCRTQSQYPVTICV